MTRNKLISFLSMIFNLFLNSACPTTFSVISFSVASIYLSIRLLSLSSSLQHPLWSSAFLSSPQISLSSVISFISQRRVAFLLRAFVSFSFAFSIRGHALGHMAEARPKRGVIYRGTRKESYGQLASYEDARRHSRSLLMRNASI